MKHVMTIRSRICALTFAAFLVHIAALSAEEAKTEFKVPMWAFFHWTSNPAVQEELRLSTEQLDKLAAVRADYNAAVHISRNRGEVPPDERAAWDAERREKGVRADEKYRPELDKALSTEQQNRLREIYVQSCLWINGPAGAGNSQIAQAIGLTDDQREMMSQIIRNYYLRFPRLKDGVVEQELIAIERSANKERDDAGNAVLTDEQKKRLAELAELAGKPFDIPGAIALFPKRPPRK